jgi:hypothetical protein
MTILCPVRVCITQAGEGAPKEKLEVIGGDKKVEDPESHCPVSVQGIPQGLQEFVNRKGNITTCTLRFPQE